MLTAPKLDWTGALITRLTELWELDLSINEIAGIMAEETGCHFTRNTVAGKAHRLGLPSRPSPIRRNPIAKRAKEKSPPPPWMGLQSPVLPLPAPFPIPPATTLAETDATRCKWLMGQVVKPERLTRRTMGGGRTWNSTQVTEPMKSDPEPVFSCWAEVPRCPNERHPGKMWCTEHCQRGLVNFVPTQNQAHSLPETPNTVE